jgi:hypothetical protein
MIDRPESAAVPDLDTSRPHPARIYDYYLGGYSLHSPFSDRLARDELRQRFRFVR